MAKLSIDSGKEPRILIESVAGDLTVRGWDHDEVVVSVAIEESASIKTVGDVIEISSAIPCRVSVPVSASLEIKEVHGPLSIKNLEGLLTIDEVAGNLRMRGTRGVVINTVNGDFFARRIEGDVRATTINGTASLRDIEGEFNAETVNGQLKLKRVSGNIKTNVMGNAGLVFGSEIGDKLDVHSSGSIHCRVPESISLTAKLTSAANSINLRTPDIRENITENTYEYSSGEGGTEIILNADGRIDFRTMVTDDDYEDEIDADFFSELGGYAADITQQVTEQVEAQIESLTRDLNERLSHLTDLGDVEKKAQAAARKAERKLASAQRRLEIKLAAAQRRAEIKSKRAAPKGDRKRYRSMEERKAKSRIDPISEEERRTILEMVAANKITVEEADKLLAALEGRTQE